MRTSTAGFSATPFQATVFGLMCRVAGGEGGCHLHHAGTDHLVTDVIVHARMSAYARRLPASSRSTISWRSFLDGLSSCPATISVTNAVASAAPQRHRPRRRHNPDQAKPVSRATRSRVAPSTTPVTVIGEDHLHLPRSAYLAPDCWTGPQNGEHVVGCRWRSIRPARATPMLAPASNAASHIHQRHARNVLEQPRQAFLRSRLTPEPLGLRQPTTRLPSPWQPYSQSSFRTEGAIAIQVLMLDSPVRALA